MGVDDAHDLLPEEIAQTLPPLSATQEQNDPLVRVKLFTPDSNWSWFVVEYGPAERLGFGLVIGFERELGYFSLAELEQVRGPWGLKLERDLYFKPMPVSQCK